MELMTPFDAPFATTARTAGPQARSAGEPMVDLFGRRISYVRVSVTDRCDLRCVYCMPERMVFLPKPEVLTLEELDRLCAVFVDLGARKLRLTGGEPLVRKGFLGFAQGLSRHLRSGALDEITLTTNGMRLAEFAEGLAAAGVRRINVSLDSLDPTTFRRIARGGDLDTVIGGIDAAQAAGLKVKINTVALANDNRAEIPALLAWAHGRGCDLSLIETMPLGQIEEDRTDQFVSLAEVRQDLAAVWTLTDIPDNTGGPARYVRVEETGGRLGFITPMTHNFCESCNRIRVTCTGVLHTCLGQDDDTDLRAHIRAGDDDEPIRAAIRQAILGKPKGHDFKIARGADPALSRHMSTTGG
jgi:cyclic pyranopterin phosphate synthase